MPPEPLPHDAEATPAELSGRIVILANPAAGRRDRESLSRFAEALASPARQVEIVESACVGDIRRLAREVEADCLLVAGGDGSVNEAVAGLLSRSGVKPVLGVIPHGTVNILARELRLPRDPSALARAYIANKVGKLHPGLANEQPFVLMASAGLDAEAVRAVRPSLKRIIGRTAYLVEAMRVFIRKSAPLEIHTDAGSVIARLAVFTKSSHYGGAFVIAADRSVHKPGLRLIVLREVGFLSLCRLALSMALDRMEQSDIIETFECRSGRICAPFPVATQIDGEALGVTPLWVRDSDETIDILLSP